MEDVREYTKYFRFVPEGLQSQGGVLSTPLMGETEAGRIYPVHIPQTAQILAGHHEWQEVQARDYDAQTRADAKEQL